MRSQGEVREWRDDDGVGVIDSPDTPGGCWAHYSSVLVEGYRSLQPGQDVTLEFEPGGQDGLAYRATAVWPTGETPVRPAGRRTVGGLHLQPRDHRRRRARSALRNPASRPQRQTGATSRW